MLVEKFVIEPSSRTESIRIGQRMPILHVWNVETKQKETLIDLRDTSLIIFDSDCISCDIPKYFKNLEIIYRDSFEIKGIFPQSFLLSDLYTIKQEHKINSCFYLLRRGSNLFDSLFIEKNGKVPVWIYINNKGLVEFINPL
jgi:hypothetical protein